MASGPVSRPGSRLLVLVQRATNLRAADCGLLGGKSDPFCACEIAGKPDSGFETEHVYQTLNPIWNEEHEIGGYEQGEDLEFEVFDYDFNDDSELLGSAVLRAAQFDREGGFEGELPLADHSAEVKAAAKGRAPALAVRVEVLPPRHEREVEEIETAGGIAALAEHRLRGEEIEVGPAAVYVSSPPRDGEGSGAGAGGDAGAAPRRPVDCVLLAHDRAGMHSGRHRQLADAFATQGWLAVVPDFSTTAADRDVWFDSIRMYCVDYFFPWLEEQGVEAIQCVGFADGAIPCAYVAAGVEAHLQGGSRVPRVVGTALAHPAFRKPYVLNEGELQKTVAMMAAPVLVVPAGDDAKEVRPGGVLELQGKLNGQPLEFLEFAQASHGFVAHGDLKSDEVRTAVVWAVDATCEFLHRNFISELAASWRVKEEPGAGDAADSEPPSP